MTRPLESVMSPDPDPTLAWDQLPRLGVRPEDLHRAGIVTAGPQAGESATHEAVSYLRTRTLHSLQENGWRRVGLSGVTEGCGASFLAANLAYALGGVAGLRTVLYDLDLTAPRIARRFRLPETAPQVSRMLDGQLAPGAALVRVSDRLAVGSGERSHTNAAERLQAPEAARALARADAALAPDVVLFDLPPATERDAFFAALGHVDTVILVARARRSTPEQVKIAESHIAGRVPLLGVVLNDTRR